MAIPLVPLALLGGAGYIGNELKKAGQRKEVMDLLRQQNQLLGDPTGGFGYGTGFGPGMLLPTSGYQNILRYTDQMGDQQIRNMVKGIAAAEPYTDRAKRRDFERNMAAARFRTQLGTQQGLTLQGQRGAQALAQQGMGGAMSALASNYQYQ